MKVSTSTKAFIGLMAAASLFVLFQAFNLHTSVELPRFLAILALASFRLAAAQEAGTLGPDTRAEASAQYGIAWLD